MAVEMDNELTTSLAPHLQSGEELLATCVASPRGWGQMMASGANIIAREIAARKQRKARAAASEAGIVVEGPMLLHSPLGACSP